MLFRGKMKVATCVAVIADPSGETDITHGFSWVCVAQSLVFCVMFCR